MLAAVLGVVLPGDDRGILGSLALAWGALVAATAALGWERARALVYLRSKHDLSLMDQLMRHVLALPIPYFERTPTGKIMQSFESLRMLRELLGTEGLRLVLDLPLLFYALVLTAAIDLRLLAVVMAALAAQLAAALVVLPRLRTKAREELAAGADARTRLVETIGGVATLRAAGDSRSGLWRWLPAFVREVRAGADQDGALLAVMAVVEALRQLSLLVIVWWGPAASSAASSASEG